MKVAGNRHAEGHQDDNDIRGLVDVKVSSETEAAG
jgi:hypothetical protein